MSTLLLRRTATQCRIARPTQLIRRRSYAFATPSPAAQRSRKTPQVLTFIAALGALAVVVVAAAPGKQTTTAGRDKAKRRAASLPALDVDSFNAYPVRWRATCTSPSAPSESGDGQHALLKVALPVSSSNAAAHLSIQTIYLAQPDINVQRPYTPLYAAPLQRGGELDLLIKRYASGEVARYAHALRVGDEALLRGVEESWRARGDEQDLVLIAAGTGVTPMYQLITSILGPPRTPNAPSFEPASLARKPRLTLLYAAASPASLLLLPELEALRAAHPELDVRLWVEQDPHASTSWLPWSAKRKVNGMPLSIGRLTARNIKQVKRPQQDVLVCGPDGMVAAIAGPKARDGRGQGVLRGTLQQLGYTAGQVWKL